MMEFSRGREKLHLGDDGYPHGWNSRLFDNVGSVGFAPHSDKGLMM